ncbi:PTS sugar transporter subunit IIA [Amphibacillus cookii]|uniref:PTS sugar transporter subunit IIA n=1 Tax=Amphibacillus cookii TaxID=767787 RepID=UPI0019570FB5|nr:fructose PTS transporter subunit IIA [Amphibacillus cookii]MBM7542817.1 PTS system fructose-specific IIA component [Amphibacillus cookii]
MNELTDQFSIADVITKDLINLDLKAQNKEDAIIELSQMLLDNGIINSVDAFSKDVFGREKEGMTGLGQGTAIPHGKSDSVIKTSLAIGRTNRPIKWESLDEKPVNIIILFAVRNTDANTVHIKLLQRVAMLLADEDFIHHLHTVESKDKMLELLSKEPAE